MFHKHHLHLLYNLWVIKGVLQCVISERPRLFIEHRSGYRASLFKRRTYSLSNSQSRMAYGIIVHKIALGQWHLETKGHRKNYFFTAALTVSKSFFYYLVQGSSINHNAFPYENSAAIYPLLLCLRREPKYAWRLQELERLKLFSLLKSTLPYCSIVWFVCFLSVRAVVVEHSVLVV